jgi:hypothetical protein
MRADMAVEASRGYGEVSLTTPGLTIITGTHVRLMPTISGLTNTK